MRFFFGRAVWLLCLGAAALTPISGCGGGDDDGGEDPPPMTEPVTWCEAEAVLEAKCQRCHGDPLENGAPFPLVTYDDTQVEVAGQPRWMKMQHVLETDFMPPKFLPDLEPPVEPLTEEEKQVLLDWLDESALPEGGTDCD
jgi:hypothetical protein